MVMEIFLTAIYSTLFCWLVVKYRFFKIAGISPWIFVGIFFIKLLSAFVLTLVYTYYYTDRSTADIFKYFDDAKIIFSALPHKPYDYVKMVTGIDAQNPDLRHYYNDCNFWFKKFDYRLYNDNRTIIRFNAVVMLFSFGHFFVHNVFMSFLSLIGLIGIYSVFVRYYESKKWELLIGIFLLPSVLLWTSGTLKEGLVVFAFGLFFYSLWNMLFFTFKIKHLLVCLCMIFILLLAKYYVIACAVPGIIYVLSIRFLRIKSDTLIWGSLLIICLTFFYVGQKIGGAVDVINTLTYKQNDFVTFSLSLEKVGSLIDNTMLKPSLFDFAKHSPGALYNSLFKPLPWDVHNILSILPCFENVLLVFLILVCVFRRNKHVESKELLVFSLSFVFCLNLLNGLIVPVFGALVRYKVPAMPFLFALLIVLNNSTLSFKK